MSATQPANPSSAPAKMHTSRLPSAHKVKGAEQVEAGSGQEAGAPDEVVASLHGEAAVAEQPVKMEADGEQQAPGMQHQSSSTRGTDALRKGQGAGRIERQNNVVFHGDWLKAPGKSICLIADARRELNLLQGVCSTSANVSRQIH